MSFLRSLSAFSSWTVLAFLHASKYLCCVSVCQNVTALLKEWCKKLPNAIYTPFNVLTNILKLYAFITLQRRRYSCLANYPWPIPELVGLKKPLSPGVCHKELAKAQTRFMFYMHDKQYLQVVPCYFYPCGRHITLQGLSTSQAPYSSTINKFNNLSNTFVIWRHPLVWSAFSALSSGTSVEKGDPSNYMPIVNIISNRLCSMETV